MRKHTDVCGVVVHVAPADPILSLMNDPLRRWRWGTCVMAAVVAVVSGEKLFDWLKRPNGGTISLFARCG